MKKLLINNKTVMYFATCLIAILFCFHALSQKPINLEQAQKMALEKNHLLKITREKVAENEQKVAEARSRKYPVLIATGNYVYNGITRDIYLPKGSLGYYPNSSIIVPQTDITILDNKHSLYSAGIVGLQPITQQGKINAGIRVAETDVEIARTQVSKAEQQIRQGVEKLYYGLLIAQKRKEESELNIELSKTRIYDVESALLAGKTDSVAWSGLQAELAINEQNLLQTNSQIEDYTTDFATLLGISVETPVILKASTDTITILPSLDTYIAIAKGNNYDIKIADQTRRKAQYGVTAAKKDFIPNLNAVAGYTHQSIINVLPNDNFFLGLQFSWNFIDFGKRKSVLNQRSSQKRQAEENIQYVQDTVNAAISKAYRKVKQSLSLVSVAQKAVSYRQKAYKLQQDKLEAGFILKKDVLETKVNLVKAEADLYSAQFAYKMALMDLEIAAGNNQ